jgi:hypothetical protein
MSNEAPAKPHLLLISLNLEPWFDERYGPLLDKIFAKAITQRAKTPDVVRLALSENKPSAILITDEALTTREHAQVWDAVLNYVREGGTAVCMGHFSSYVNFLDIKPFFAKAGLPWEVGAYLRAKVTLNEDTVGIDLEPSLPECYSQKALFLKNVEDAAAWYYPSEDEVIESLMTQTPVALAKVGEGKLGYVGDVNKEEGSDAVVLAMCGLSA